MDRSETTKNGIWYIFHGYRKRQFGYRKRLLIVVMVLTILAVLYSRDALDVSLSKLMPASTACKKTHTPTANGATRKLTHSSDGATSKLTPDTDGAARKLTPSSDGATSKLTPDGDGPSRKLNPSSDGATSKLTTADDGATRKLTPSSDGATSKLSPAADSATNKLTPADDGATSKLTRAPKGESSHVLLYDYALDKAYLPTWFFNVSMAKLTTRLRARQKREAARNPPLPLTYVNMSSSTRKVNWVVFQRHIRSSSLYNNDDPAVDGLLRDMATLPIVATEAMTKGNRLKLSVQFKDGGWAVLKTLNADDEGRREPPRSEIAGFHLDRVLDFSIVPPTVGRRVNIRSELAPKVSHTQDMFINVTQDGRVCFGRTFNTPRQACGEPNFVDVSLQHHLRDAGNRLLYSRKNPWGYKVLMCQHLDTCKGKTKHRRKHMKKTCTAARAGFNSSSGFDSGRWALDTLDAAYFDMLIDNWDRHSFGYLKKINNTLILFDNGKGFHSTSQDSVLSDFLYKRRGCCLMKKTTFLKFLKLFLGPQRLSDLMMESLRADPLAPVLSQDQLHILDRRLGKIIGFINDCFKEHGIEDVLLDDMDPVSDL